MLPLSKIDPAKAKAIAAMFSDTGVAVLLPALMDLGAEKGRLTRRCERADAPILWRDRPTCCCAQEVLI